MQTLKTIFTSAIHLFYPHLCNGCGSDIISTGNLLCLRCINELPYTNEVAHADNHTEKIFYGRIPIESAFSQFYFAKETLIQNLIHQLKYKSNTAIGFYLGTLMGKSISESKRFANIDSIVPLPLYPDKERKRGYNQATVLCNGIASVLGLPVLNDVVCRQRFTQTQTKKRRTERWQNVEGSFVVTNTTLLQNKNILLVDDVITTGATIEACSETMLKNTDVKLHVAALAYASK
jgi:ComF family protein